MASSSSPFLTSSILKSFKYHVYVSFGEDIRNTTFIDHLFEALLVEGICTYKDDEKLKKGETIDEDLLKVIEESKFLIIVLSKNYTSSPWCLNELVKIMECSKTSHQMAFPIFYYVDPNEVRSEFGEAFDILDKKEVAKWRWALMEATRRINWNLRSSVVNNRDIAKVIKEIVKEISRKLTLTNLWGDVNLVGMETRAEDVVSSLETGFEDALMIGIKGIGGIGKTTLAKTIYDKIYNQFEGCSFVEDVREVSRASGFASLQKKILSDVLHDEDITLGSVLYGKSMMKEKLHCKKVLLVLDDVDHRDQLEALAGAPDWFKPGSRIIVTTRDEQVLLAHGVKCIHTVECLLHEEAIYLFSRHAFGREIPIQGYEELSRQFVRYTAGIPLGIKVLGSFLCGKKELQWVDALDRLKAIPLAETPELLEFSYNDLDVDCKEIFLDVACFLKRFSLDKVIKILEIPGFYAGRPLRILEKRSLITINNYQYIVMHPLIEAMGKDIVRRVHLNDPDKHSRLWILDEIEYVLAKNLGTEATKAIAVDNPVKLCSEVVTKGFGSMPNLRLLRVVSEIEDDCDEKIGQTSLNFPNALRFLSWEGYPYWSLPKRFKAYNLVALEMPYSRITQLWEGGEKRILYKLEFLNLKHSRLRTLDLQLTPNLERLDLEGCNGLVELWEGGERKILYKLKFLNLIHSRLRTLDLQLTPNLERLDLEGCNDLVELWEGGERKILYKLKFLNLKHSRLRTLDLQLTPNLERLDLEGCIDLVELWEGGERKILYKLKFLNLKHSRLRTLDLQLTPNLERLDLEGCNDLVELWEGGERKILYKLKFLNLKHSRLRTLDLQLTPNLERLDLEGCNDLVELWEGGERKILYKLKFLNLKHSRLRTLDLQLTPNLERLDLEGCNDLVELWEGGERKILYKLKFLNLKHSRLRTLDLQLTPNLERLDLEGCNDLVELWEGGEREILYDLKFLNLKHSRLKTLDLRLTPYLERLDLEGCNDLVELHLPHIGYLESLFYANLSGCSRIKKSIPEKGTLQELEFRYIGLPDHTLKEIFLDVACLLKGLLKDDVMRIIASTSEYEDGKYALRVLEEASLISIDDNRYVVMHPHIEEMGKNIVHRMHLDKPNQQSRLWIREEIEYVLAKDLGTEVTRAIVVDSPVKLLSQAVTKGFGSMKNLKLLSVVSDMDDDCDESNGQIIPSFPNDLRFLSWVGYPHGSLPKTFEAYKLVALEMPCSRITQLWEEGERKTFFRLKFLNLRNTQLRTLDLGVTPNLERLELEGCNHLVELFHTPISRLVYLNLSGCSGIKSFEFIKELGSLEILSLSRLYLKEFPDIIPRHRDIRLLELQFRYNDIEELPSSIANLQKLVRLDFHSCRKLRSLSDSICRLKHLRNLKLYGCCCLKELPEDIGRLGCLEKLNLSYTRIKHLPDSICKLIRLKTLKVSFCRNLEKLPGDIGRLACLKKLILKKCIQVRHIPDSVCQLKSLEYLSLLDCVELEKLPRKLGDVGSLKVLNVKGTNIRRLPLSISSLVDLEIHAPKKTQSCFD